MDEDREEALETFKVNLLRVIGGARLGNVTSVTVSIPANDSPQGRFGFQQLEVQTNAATLNQRPEMPWWSIFFFFLNVVVDFSLNPTLFLSP